MESNKLNAHQIVTGRNARWHGEVMPSAIRDHGVNRPFAAAQTVVSNFEPLKSTRASRGRIVDLGKIVLDWACYMLTLYFIVCSLFLEITHLYDSLQ